MTRLRQTIAQRLVDAQHTAAMLTTFNEVDMSAVMDLRASTRSFEKKHGVKLGFMSFFVKAVRRRADRSSRRSTPTSTATDIVYQHFYDIGVAVSAPRRA